jgi:hypothetical protein
MQEELTIHGTLWCVALHGLDYNKGCIACFLLTLPLASDSVFDSQKKVMEVKDRDQLLAYKGWVRASVYLTNSTHTLYTPHPHNEAPRSIGLLDCAAVDSLTGAS